MYLPDNVQKTLRELEKINQNEVVQKQGDVYVAVNVLTGNSRILQGENNLIESLVSQKKETNLLKG